MKNASLPQVAIIGRANVGKSTLFNRLIEKDKAIVSRISGTTRDRNIDTVFWQGRSFVLIDTGGLDIDKGKHSGKIEKNIIKQTETAIKNADLILFLTDVKAGIMPADKKLAKKIISKKLKNKAILIGNKADNLKWRQDTGELYRLNLGDPQMVSAISGAGTGDLLDIIVKKLIEKKHQPLTTPSTDKQTSNQQSIKVAIIGRPNVGKSSLLNSILGEERVMVTDIPHTTRESHDTKFKYKKNNFILIDTAGIRKQNKIIHGSLEKKSVNRSLKTIREADVVLFVTEAQKTIDKQDKKITQAILEAGISMILVANKWDLIKNKKTNTIKEFIDYYYSKLPYLWWAPIIFISAKTGQRSRRILDLILEIKKARETKISKSQLNRFLGRLIKKHRPSRGKGLKNPYIYEIEQTGINPPRFIIHVNDPKILHFSYIRAIQNGLRKEFGIIGTPLQIEARKRENTENKKLKN